jgi:hypothetical protein
VLETDRVFVVRLVSRRGRAYLLLAKRGLPGPDQVPALRGVLAAGTGRHPQPMRRSPDHA